MVSAPPKPKPPTYSDAIKLARRMLAAVGIEIEHPQDRYAAEVSLANVLWLDVPGTALRGALYLSPSLERQWHEALRGEGSRG